MDQKEFTKNIELFDELIKDCEKTIILKQIRIKDYQRLRNDLVKYIVEKGFTPEAQILED